MKGKASNCPGSKLKQMAEREGESRTRKSDRYKPVGSAVLHGHGQGDRKEEDMSRGERGHVGIKNKNSCVTYCVQGLEISVCC